MRLDTLLERLEYKVVQGSAETEVTTLINDSRKVENGSVFVCISGAVSDGHKYAAEVAEKGAAALVVEKDVEVPADVTVIKVEDTRYALALMSAAYFGYPAEKLKIVGITGTKGKTTTTYMIKSILEETGHKVGLIGTIEAIIGEKHIPAANTTPESFTIQQYFAQMVEEGCDSVVMEVSSHALALDRVTACTFDVGAFTNITQDHLDFHKTMEEYLAAKSILFNICNTGVVNKDDARSEYLIENARCRNMITYGINQDCDLKASNIILNEDGVKFDINYGGMEEHVDLPIPGEFSVYNALTAIGCCMAENIPLDLAVDGLHSAKGVKGRIEIVRTPGTNYTVIIDYAHTPDGLLNVINAIRGFAKGRIVTLFGCGGDRDASKRPIMGKIAGELSDFCIVTSDNPRTEDPEKIIKQVVEGVKQTDCDYEVITNRFSAIEYALDHAKKNDIILLAGKGHETYQVLGKDTIKFDEREIVQKLLGCYDK